MKVWISGACGYVGSALVPHLLAIGCKVVAYDCQMFGDGFLPKSNGRLKVIKGDIRDAKAAAASMVGCEAVIHLAGLTSDAGCQLEPEVAQQINVFAFERIVEAVAVMNTERFIFMSSSAAYGSTDYPAAEKQPLAPTTAYGHHKALCEVVLKANNPTVPAIILRPAGVCGYAPRMRFDLTVNRMVRDAFFTGEINVHGGDQVRPNLHIRDLIAAIKTVLTAPREKVIGQTFNVGCENASVMDVAKIVAENTGAEIKVTPRQDNRSYSIDASKIKRALDFIPRFTIESAVYDLHARFKSGYWKDAMENQQYMNVRGAALEREAQH